MGFGGRCSRCGAVVPDGQAGCRRLFEEVLALEYGDPAELPGDLYDRMRDGRFVIFHNWDASMRPVMV